MDNARFDELARTIARSLPRRAFLKFFLGGAFNALPGGLRTTASAKKGCRKTEQECVNGGECCSHLCSLRLRVCCQGVGGSCTRNAQCCSGVCDPRRKRCTCRTATTSCRGDDECCTGLICAGGACRRGCAADADCGQGEFCAPDARCYARPISPCLGCGGCQVCDVQGPGHIPVCSETCEDQCLGTRICQHADAGYFRLARFLEDRGYDRPGPAQAIVLTWEGKAAGTYLISEYVQRGSSTATASLTFYESPGGHKNTLVLFATNGAITGSAVIGPDRRVFELTSSSAAALRQGDATPRGRQAAAPDAPPWGGGSCNQCQFACGLKATFGGSLVGGIACSPLSGVASAACGFGLGSLSGSAAIPICWFRCVSQDKCNACPKSYIQQQGSCLCPSGQTDCGVGGCHDLQNDPGRCGSCDAGAICALGQECAQGHCCGGANKRKCGGACVDTSTDPMNCGGCAGSGGGTECSGGEECSGGKCLCPVGQRKCGNTCVSESMPVGCPCSDQRGCGGQATQCCVGCFRGTCASICDQGSCGSVGHACGKGSSCGQPPGGGKCTCLST